jgi:hypothetical protein
MLNGEMTHDDYWQNKNDILRLIDAFERNILFMDITAFPYTQLLHLIAVNKEYEKEYPRIKSFYTPENPENNLHYTIGNKLL